MSFLSDGNLSLFGSKYSSLSKLSGKGENLLGETLKAAETVGSAFSMAYANGRFATPGQDHVEIVKDVPADLAIGLAGLGLSLAGVFGKYSEHADNLANGMLCTYAGRIGTKLGAEARLKDASAPAVKGEFHTAPPRNAYDYNADMSWAR